MSSVHAVTQDIVFKARVASFYQMTGIQRQKLCQEFGDWLKEKGSQNDFLVWRVEIIIQGEPNVTNNAN